jgi:hypothetical protein
MAGGESPGATIWRQKIKNYQKSFRCDLILVDFPLQISEELSPQR